VDAWVSTVSTRLLCSDSAVSCVVFIQVAVSHSFCYRSPLPDVNSTSVYCIIYRYDTYTPTRNVVFHIFDKQANGHGDDEWFKRQKTRLRLLSINRVQTALQLKDGDDSEAAQANLGLYGLGKRRSLKQLNEFANVDLHKRKGNNGLSIKCSGHAWIPYDTSISSMENLFSNPDNLDSQPEYPMRTKLTFYEQVKESMPALDLDIAETTGRLGVTGSSGDVRLPSAIHSIENERGSLPSATMLFVFWAFGLVVWCLLFMNPSANSAVRPKRKTATYKDV
jgi:hypothetical protein